MKIYYHATPRENLTSILNNGLKMGDYGCVFMTEKEDESLRFAIFRPIPVSEIATFKIKIHKKDYDKIQEMFDHNPDFFKCKSFGYFGDIPAVDVELLNIYQNPMIKNNN